jgi:hypothetical protein
MVIRRVHPLSIAKIAGLLYALMGLIVGVFFSLFFMAFGQQMQSETHMPFLGALMGAGAVITMPIFYGVLGFVTSAIAAMIYNLLAGAVGGIEIEVDGAGTVGR